jgi:Phycobilisome protein
MQSHFETLFEAANDHYPRSEDINTVTQYAASLPERLKAYQRLRDQEVKLLQKVVDQLQEQFPETSDEILERSLRNGALVLRYCGMGMLTNDLDFVRSRISSWLSESLPTEQHPAEAALFQLVEKLLSQLLTPNQQALFQPMFTLAIDVLNQAATPAVVAAPELEEEEELTLAGMF